MKELHALCKRWLQEQKLRVADVGSTGGISPRWRSWMDLCYFYSFDPDPRANMPFQHGKNFQVGLWSSACKKSLHLAHYPPASSLFDVDKSSLAFFSQAPCFQSVGKQTLELDTLDHLLASSPIDFLKIDAEGAELEILKGGQHQLAQHCLGVQLETYFYPIRKQTPTFSELDLYMQQQGFELFQLEREHWVRKNHIYTPSSCPQLIWANALYLRSKKTLLEKADESLIARYLMICLIHGLYDYAFEVCEQIPYPCAKHLQALLKQLPKGKLKDVKQLLLSLVFGSLKYVCCLNKDKKRHHLCYLRRKGQEMGKLCLYLSRSHTTICD